MAMFQLQQMIQKSVPWKVKDATMGLLGHVIINILNLHLCKTAKTM